MARMIDLTGEKIGKLSVIKYCGKNERGDNLWKVKCECGNERIMTSSNLSHAKSCGCLHPKEDLTGMKFGRWTVAKRVESKIINGRKNHRRYLCICECGTEKILPAYSLKHGLSKSCGCLRKDNLTTHNMSNTRLFEIWSEIKYRCKNNTHETYKTYEKKGIKMCQEWESDFMNFYRWAVENGYVDDLTIDRIDNNKGYYPENCRWVTNKVQMNNQDRSVRILYKNEWLPISKVAELEKKPYMTIYSRIRRGRYPKRRLYETENENRIV